MVFTKSNPPPGYYVYLYLREDGTPYYVGKGIGSRAWDQHRRYNKGAWTPKDRSKIIIVAYGLVELWALALERRFIFWYGRKDVDYSTDRDYGMLHPKGILMNRSEGGDGFTSDDVQRRWDDPLSSYNSPEFGKSISITNKKIRQDPSSVYNSVEYRDTLSKTITAALQQPEERARRSRVRCIIDWLVTDPNGVEYKVKNLNEFAPKHNLRANSLFHVAAGRCKQHRGWRCCKL